MHSSSRRLIFSLAQRVNAPVEEGRHSDSVRVKHESAKSVSVFLLHVVLGHEWVPGSSSAEQ